MMDFDTIAACLEGLSAKNNIDMTTFHDSNQYHHLSIFDQFLEFMDYTNSRNRMKMYHVIAALRMVGLDHEWGKVFNSWRESNGNNEDLLKSLDDGENRKEYMLTCNALADCFAGKKSLIKMNQFYSCFFLFRKGRSCYCYLYHQMCVFTRNSTSIKTVISIAN